MPLILPVLWFLYSTSTDSDPCMPADPPSREPPYCKEVPGSIGRTALCSPRHEGQTGGMARAPAILCCWMTMGSCRSTAYTRAASGALFLLPWHVIGSDNGIMLPGKPQATFHLALTPPFHSSCLAPYCSSTVHSWHIAMAHPLKHDF